VKALVETGKYRPVIDRRYALDEVVEATRYVETGQKTGNVVLRVSEAASDFSISGSGMSIFMSHAMSLFRGMRCDGRWADTGRAEPRPVSA
jgi:Zinc-binding dehydrogenase